MRTGSLLGIASPPFGGYRLGSDQCVINNHQHGQYCHRRQYPNVDQPHQPQACSTHHECRCLHGPPVDATGLLESLENRRVVRLVGVARPAG